MLLLLLRHPATWEGKGEWMSHPCIEPIVKSAASQTSGNDLYRIGENMKTAGADGS